LDTVCKCYGCFKCYCVFDVFTVCLKFMALSFTDCSFKFTSIGSY